MRFLVNSLPVSISRACFSSHLNGTNLKALQQGCWHQLAVTIIADAAGIRGQPTCPPPCISTLHGSRDQRTLTHPGALSAAEISTHLILQAALQGSWDQPTATIVMHNAQPRRLQSLALQFAEKAATMVDLNERALVMRTGGMRDTEDEGRGGNYGEGNFGSRR